MTYKDKWYTDDFDPCERFPERDDEKGCTSEVCTASPGVFQTETDLVKLEDVLAVCSAYCPDDDGSCSKSGHDLREMPDEIEAIPTIKAEPVRHGQWIQRRNGEYYCTNCGREEKFIFQKDYCPRCGVYMKEEIKCDGTEPVRIAEWDGCGGCKACGRSLYELIDSDSYLKTKVELYGTPFCPFCGAKIGGVDSGD